MLILAVGTMVKRFEVCRCSKFRGYVDWYSNGRIDGIEFRKSDGCLLYRGVQSGQVKLYLELNQNIRIISGIGFQYLNVIYYC